VGADQQFCSSSAAGVQGTKGRAMQLLVFTRHASAIQITIAPLHAPESTPLAEPRRWIDEIRSAHGDQLDLDAKVVRVFEAGSIESFDLPGSAAIDPGQIALPGQYMQRRALGHARHTRAVGGIETLCAVGHSNPIPDFSESKLHAKSRAEALRQESEMTTRLTPRRERGLGLGQFTAHLGQATLCVARGAAIPALLPPTVVKLAQPDAGHAGQHCKLSRLTARTAEKPSLSVGRRSDRQCRCRLDPDR
jgi:hypothetical protein